MFWQARCPGEPRFRWIPRHHWKQPTQQLVCKFKPHRKKWGLSCKIYSGYCKNIWKENMKKPTIGYNRANRQHFQLQGLSSWKLTWHLNIRGKKKSFPTIHFLRQNTVSFFRERLYANQPKKTLVGGFNPFEKYSSKWESSPNRGENNIWTPLQRLNPRHFHFSSLASGDGTTSTPGEPGWNPRVIWLRDKPPGKRTNVPWKSRGWLVQMYIFSYWNRFLFLMTFVHFHQCILWKLLTRPVPLYNKWLPWG